MPGLDRTGPTGQGPGTGKQKGRCSNKAVNFENVLVDDTPAKGRNRLMVMNRKGCSEAHSHHHQHNHDHGHGCQHQH